MSSQRSFKYPTPPVVEVVCGIQFNTLQKLLTPHLGSLWELYQKEGYTECEEHPPLPRRIEPLHRAPLPHITLNKETAPPFPRIWFLHETSDKIIQIQRDRFIFNWRAFKPGSQYPGLDSIVNDFEKHFRCFEDFMMMQGERIKQIQYELSYLDHIPRGEEWENLGDLGLILNRLIAKGRKEHFLDRAESVNWRTSFQLSADARLSVAIRNRILPQKKEVLQIEWTARGPLARPSTSTKENSAMLPPSREWFKLAREHIRQKFMSLFNEDVQTKMWGKKDVYSDS